MIPRNRGAYLMSMKMPFWLTIGEFAKFDEFGGPITSWIRDCGNVSAAGSGMYTLS